MEESGLGTWGKEEKCSKDGTCEARGTARPKAEVPLGELYSDKS